MQRDSSTNTRSGKSAKDDRRQTLTADHDETIVARLHEDPAFARAFFDKCVELIVAGEPKTARIMLRNIINATVGFEQLAKQLDKHPKTLHQMVSTRGNPAMDNLSDILRAVREAITPKRPPKTARKAM